MTPGPHVILAPRVVQITLGLEPIYNIMATMQLLASQELEEVMPGWLRETATSLAPERRHMHRLAMNPLYYLFDALADQGGPRGQDFEGVMDTLAAADPGDLQREIIRAIWRARPRHLTPDTFTPAASPEALLADRDGYLAHMEQFYDDRRFYDPAFLGKVHDLLNDPNRLHGLIVEDLRFMWQEVVASEWERVAPILQGVVEAFGKVEGGPTLFEAMQTVTGRDLSSVLRLDLSSIEQLVLIPSAHIGPYVMPFIGRQRMLVVFGARMPEGMRASSPDVSRSELLVRLNALADDTRLRILDLLTQHDELCAQEIIALLNLSQSAASRHLRQLSATGYLKERRQEGAKCYTLNPERVEDTLAALAGFLLGR